MIYVIDLDGIVRGVLSNDIPEGVPFWDDLFVETVEDGMAVFEFKCPADNDVASNVKVENYVAIHDKDGHLVLLKIREIQTIHDADGLLYKQVFAENAALELLKTIVRPTNLSGASPVTALQAVLEGTLWQPGEIQITGSKNFEFNDYPTAVAAIQEIKDAFEAEVRFRIELDGARIIRRRVDLLERRGQETGKRFTYSKDVKSIVRTEDTSELFTAVIAVGKKDINGNEVTLADASGTFTNKYGTIITKPLGQDFIGDPDALARWSDDGQHLMGVLKTEETAANVLLQVAWDYLQKHTEPKITYEVDVALLENLTGGEYAHEAVRLGDTLIVEDLSFEPPLVLEARVIEAGFSMTDPERDYVKLGNFVELEITVEDQLAQLLEKVRENEERWNSGGETIHKANTPPSNPQPGQLWLDTSTEPEVLKRWDGTTWRKATPTQAIEVGAETPKGAQDKADIAAYKSEKAALVDLKMRVDYQVSRLLAQEYLKTQPIIDELNAAKANYDSKLSDLIAAINTAIGDLDVTQEERDAVDAARIAYEAAVDRLAAAIEDAEADVTTNVESGAVEQSQEFVEQYAERKITKGNSAPAFPEVYDLWIDTSVTPPVWKQWDGTSWTKISRTDLSEMLGQLQTEQIANQAIVSEKLADVAVTEEKIAALAVTLEKIANGAITDEKLADLAVTAEKLADSSVTATKIANLAVGTAAIQDGAITNAKISSLDAAKITTGTLDAARIGAGSITAEKIAAGTITATQIASRTITADKIAARTITANEIAVGAITANEIAAGSITTNHISAAGLDAGVITAGTMSAERIYGGTIKGTSIDVGNAGMVDGDPEHYQSVRIWAGGSLENRELAPFRVQANGTVYMSNAIILGGSISISEDAYVGNNLYLGYYESAPVQKSIVFNDMSKIIGGVGQFGGDMEIIADEITWFPLDNNLAYGWTFKNYGYYSKVKFTVENGVESEFYDTVRLFAPFSINGVGAPGNTWYAESSGGHFMTSNVEEGFCGVGGMGGGSTGACAGVGVNFRTVKGYVPSSVSTVTSAGNASPIIISITRHGFWLYIEGGGSVLFRFWRGTYSA